MDILFIGLALLLFGLSLAMLVLLERLGGSQ